MRQEREYYVLRVKGGNQPTKAHSTYTEAHTEAKRLAKLHPNVDFIVAQARCVVTAEPPEPETSYFM